MSEAGGRRSLRMMWWEPADRHFGKAARDIYIPGLWLGSDIRPGEPVEGIKVRTRDFR